MSMKYRERKVETLALDGYFLDLYEETGLNSRGDYVEIAHLLFDIPFKAALTLDLNRSYDALVLREEIISRRGNKYSGQPNCLEVLWCLALDMSDLSLEGDGYSDPTDDFWELFSNLGLQKFKEMGSISEAREAHFLINNWLDRRYDRSGNGGIFPLRKAGTDQRKVEIWYQMQEYLEENSGVCG